MTPDVSGIDAIGRTAIAVAALRDAEGRRPGALFHDPYAAAFLAAAGDVLGPADRAAGFAALMRTQVAVRTRFLDDQLRSAVEDGCRQVVLVAAGLDSRPWRLDWPGDATVFDLDQEPVLRFKDAVMAARLDSAAPVRRAVAADLRGDWAERLAAAGFDARRRTGWLVEGLLYSLDEDAADRLLGTLTGLSAAGSTLAFDHFETGPSLRAATDRIDPGLTRLWRRGPADPAGWLRRHGWRPDVRELADVAATSGSRPHPAYDGSPGAEGRSWLGTAVLDA